MTKRCLELVFFDAGGGHRSAAEALKSILAVRYPEWDVRLVNLQDILKSADPLFILTGVKSENFYNAALKMGLTYGSRPFLRGLQTVIKICAVRMESILRKHWQESGSGPLDAVVSLVPNFNGVMFRALQRARPSIPFITIMTDMADLPPHFWQEKQDQYLICGTGYAMQQARATKWYRPERLHQTSGMIVRPDFYAPSARQKLTLRQIGFMPSKTTALIMFGGYGSTVAEQIVDRVNKAGISLQMIVMCGKNNELFKRLSSKDQCVPIAYTKEIASYMRLCDFMIGKPGPGSLSEAWHMGLPVIVESNARTMIQERKNIAILKEFEAGVVIKNFRSIAETIDRLLMGNRLSVLKANVRRLRNNAIFEIPGILNDIMSEIAPGGRPKGLRAPRKFARLARKIRRKTTLTWH